MDGDKTFFDDAVRAVDGDAATAEVAVGQTADGLFTATALRVPGADGTHMVDALIEGAGWSQTSRRAALSGDRPVTIVGPLKDSRDNGYVMATGDCVVIVTTADDGLASSFLADVR